MKNLILAFTLLLLPILAVAELVSITFEPPTERHDGTPLSASEIDFYRVFDSGVEIPQDAMAFTGNTLVTDLPYGKRTITMTTMGTDGRESLEPSIPFTFVLNANPKAPKIIGANRLE